MAKNVLENEQRLMRQHEEKLKALQEMVAEQQRRMEQGESRIRMLEVCPLPRFYPSPRLLPLLPLQLTELLLSSELIVFATSHTRDNLYNL